MLLVVLGIALVLFVEGGFYYINSFQSLKTAVAEDQKQIAELGIKLQKTEDALAGATEQIKELSDKNVDLQKALQVTKSQLELALAQLKVLGKQTPPQEIRPTSNCITAPYLENSPLLTDVCAYYRLDGDATDENDNQHDLASTDITYVPGRFGKAAFFDGANSFLEINSNLGIKGGPTTLLAWVKPSILPAPNEQRTFLQLSDSSTGVHYYMFVENSDGLQKVGFTRYRSPRIEESSLRLAETLSTQQWYLMGLVYDGATVVGYINGVKRGSILASGVGSQGSPDKFRIGRGLGASTNIFNGSVDEAAVFTRPLSAKEISDYYNWALKQPSGN